jgi:hypothetical protein
MKRIDLKLKRENEEDEVIKGTKKLKNNLIFNLLNKKKIVIKKAYASDMSVEYDDFNNISHISVGFSSEKESGGMNFNSNELKSIEIIF